MKNTKYFLTIFICVILIFSGCATKKESDANASNGVTSDNDISSNIPAQETEILISDVLEAYKLLYKSKMSEAVENVSDSDIYLLGIVDDTYNLYQILPQNASGNTVMTYQTYQGYTVISGTEYSPSAFALYLYDKNDKILYTIEDGANRVDFSLVYNLLPDNMKK